MKNIIYTLIIAAFSLSALTAQDVSLTNTKLDPPASGEIYGQACFTIVAEDGIALTNVPLSVEVSLSKVNFETSSIFGFNSDKFSWEADSFSPNVITGTLISSILDVDNGEGGAQICIPVNRDNIEEYEETRNGFLVNIVPGGLDQPTSNDDITRFGFSPVNATSARVNESSNTRNIFEGNEFEISVFPNPTSEYVKISTSNSIDNMTLTVLNNNGQKVYQNNRYSNLEEIEIQQWTPGMYLVELRDNNNKISNTKKLIVTK